ncbi:Protein RRP5 like protein [Habropoda laboriosa]|uniref:Protein RRP5 like protein n=1 Tax=Habropoda laboriosa TaxID=597456 RepID=A0A0L7QSJ9_9HYME|nr:Protein RRP5 like protein [Habropoda laboriosa]
MTLKSFPRGGKKVQEEKSSNLLFKKQEKISKKNHKRDKAKAENEEEEKNFVAITADRLSYATISEGLIVLGCISEVTEYDLMISLPGGIIGHAQITDISDSYTNLLQSLIKSENSQTNEFKLLPELYSCGEYVVCYVKSIQPQETWQIAISLEPRLINQNLNINHIDDGSKIVCTISSIEDHGCVVDVGLPNVRAFIPAKESTNEKCLCKQLLCYINEVKISENNSIIKLSAAQKLAKSTHNTEIKSLDSLLPGTTFNLFIKKVLSNGLCVSFGNNYVGYINQLYLDQHLSKYSKGMEITGILLYILPTVKFGYFSSTVHKPRDNTIKSGDVIEEATTLFKEAGGVVLQLTKSGMRGFVPLKRTNVDYDKITEKFVPGSIHKCRVISFSWMDGTYFCTMQSSLLEQKYFSLSDFKPGDVVNVKITNINEETGFINVQIGKFHGQVAPDHVSDEGLSALKKLKINKEVEARVLTVNTARHRVYLTLKRSLIATDLPILTDIQDAKYGSKYYGTIAQINKYGLLVKFFGEVKGWLPKIALIKGTSDANWNYSIGQTILVKIESVDEDSGKMILSLGRNNLGTKVEEVKFVIGEQVEGTITESSIQGVYLQISRNDGQSVSTGFLPTGHMSPCMDTAALLASKCIPGETLSALVFATVPSLILTRTILPEEKYRNFEMLKEGNYIPCSIRDFEPDGIRVILPVTGGAPFGYISYSNVSNFNLLCVNQILFAKVTSINRKKKELGLTLSLKKIFDGLRNCRSRMVVAVDTLSLYFNKLAELAKNSFYKNRPISSVKLGQRVVGKIEKITNDGLVVQLPNNLLGIVSKDHYARKKKVGDKISGTIMWKNYVHELVELTTLPSVMNKISAKQNKQLQLPEGKLFKGKILMVTNWFLLIVLKGIGKGTLAAMPTRRHMNDIQPDLSPYSVHSKIRCYVLLNSNESDIMPICMVKSAFEKKYCKQTEHKEDNNLKRKTKVKKNNEVPAKKIKTEEVEVPVKKEHSEEKLEEVLEEKNLMKASVKQTRQKKVKKVKQEKEDEEVKLTEEDKTNVHYNVDAYEDNEEEPRIPECGFFWDDKPDVALLKKEESSSDSEGEKEQEPKQKKKKLSGAESREQERQKEREIRQREEALASNQLPNSVDQFDRLVLASPDSSIIWLQYMAYHLQTTEIEKARAVARKAVKTINFREENERLNVWNAWLNLESKFGTPESLNDVFQEAVRSNDSLKIYSHMLTVYAEAGRQIELEKIINTMIGKFKQNPQIWIDCGATLLKIGLKEKSRHIMQRALQSLPASEHVNLMARFAVLENKFGDKERSQTLFEQILNSYPKRVDIWSCYIDSLIKSNDIDIARKVLERAVVQTLPPRKMKSLFKKFINFEEQHGTQEDVARVQQMAVEYVEKQCNKDA